MQASQTLMIDDIQHLTVTGNIWAAGPDHAIGPQNHSSDAHANNNELDRSIVFVRGSSLLERNIDRGKGASELSRREVVPFAGVTDR